MTGTQSLAAAIRIVMLSTRRWALHEEMGETVMETAQGWELRDGRIIRRNKARLSPDRLFHTGALMN
jgi:hypothetical protein